MEQQEKEISEVSTRDAGMRYGLFGAVIGIVLFVISDKAGFEPWITQVSSVVLTIVLLVVAHDYFKKNNGGFMEYGQGIGVSFWMGLISALISSLFTYVYAVFIAPDFLDKLKAKEIVKMQTEQGMSSEQIDQAMPFIDPFFNPTVVAIMGLVMGVAMTVIIGLIVTIFTHKKNKDLTFS